MVIILQLMMMIMLMSRSPEKVAKVAKVAVREAVGIQVRNARSLISYKRRIWILYNSHLII